MLDEITPQNLSDFGFVDRQLLLDVNQRWGSALWYHDGEMYIVGPDCPNVNYATKVTCHNMKDVEDLYKILTKK